MDNAKRSLCFEFLNLPAFDNLSDKAKLLYVYLNTMADDFGFTNRAMKIMRYANAEGCHMKELFDNGFLLHYKNPSVTILVHWQMNNSLRKDRCKTRFPEVLGSLGFNERTKQYYPLIDENTPKRIETCIQKHYVYLIQNENRIKIGETNNLEKRLKALQTAAPSAKILAYKISENSKNEEEYYHKMFKHKRYKLEWFNLDETDINYLLNDGFVKYNS